MFSGARKFRHGGGEEAAEPPAAPRGGGDPTTTTVLELLIYGLVSPSTATFFPSFHPHYCFHFHSRACCAHGSAEKSRLYKGKKREESDRASPHAPCRHLPLLFSQKLPPSVFPYAPHTSQSGVHGLGLLSRFCVLASLPLLSPTPVPPHNIAPNTRLLALTRYWKSFK